MYYNYNFRSILPPILNTSLGYPYNYTYFSQNGSISGFVGINQYINSNAISLPIGYYLCSAYCLYTLTAITPYYTTLINTVQSKITPIYNYSRQYCPAIINLNQNINYQFYLQNNAITNYYFVFHTGSNSYGGLINSFNGSFIRIA